MLLPVISGFVNAPIGAAALSSITGFGTGIATALAVNTGSAGAPVLFNGAGGTPSSLTLTNATGLPNAAVIGLGALATITPGTGVATFLATPTSANLLAAVTDETGTGALVFATSPTLVTPTLGAATATSLAVPTLTTVGTVTGGASNMTITAGTGNSRTLIFQTTTSGGVATTALTLNADQSATLVGALNGTTIPTSKTLVVTTDTLAVHAATTSAQLAGIISDETGTGSLVFGTSPFITTGVLNSINAGDGNVHYQFRVDSVPTIGVTAIGWGGGITFSAYTSNNAACTLGHVEYVMTNVTAGAHASDLVFKTYTAAAESETLRLVGATKTTVHAGPSRLKGYTVSTLPSGTTGDEAYVTDALAPTFLATVVGGGAVVTPVFYNGTNWVGS